MTASRLDKAYRKLVLSKFFTKGWGSPENLKKLFEFRKLVSDRRLCYQLVSPNHHVVITKEVNNKDHTLLEGHFLSPFYQYLPDLLPKEARKAYFQVLLPKKWDSETYRPVCLHLAGTGDHFFFRRRNLMAKPMLKESGVGAILLENPFYGMRKPKDQVWSCLHNVSDIFVMGGCLILESLVLFHWCKRNGLGPLGVTGISMGGHMASLAATAWPEPLVVVPCLSWSTASIVFTRGVMSGAVNWDLLEAQYFDNDIFNKEIQRMVRVVDDFLGGCSQDASYAAGQHFAQNFPEVLHHVQDMSSESNPVTQVQTTSSDNISPAQQSESTKTAATQDIAQLTNSVHSNNNLQSEPTKGDQSRNVLLEVLEESNLGHYAKFIDKNDREELEISPISIRNYLSFINKADAPAKKAVEEPDDVKELQRQQASRFMCGIMDECTHLSNFSVPVDPELVISVTAKDDAYVPRDGITDIRDIWKGAEVRYLNAGHVGAYLLHQKVFRSAITDGFSKLKQKYYNSESSQKISNE